MKANHKFVLVALLVLICSGLFLLFDHDFISKIRYGSVGAMRNRLHKLNNITLLHEWRHEDLTIEDFGFTVESGAGTVMRIDFLESLEWHGLFRSYDGVVVSTPYDFTTNSDTSVYLTKKELMAKGIPSGGAASVFENLDQVVRVARLKGFSKKTQAISNNWIILCCDLDESSYFGHPLLSTHKNSLLPDSE